MIDRLIMSNHVLGSSVAALASAVTVTFSCAVIAQVNPPKTLHPAAKQQQPPLSVIQKLRVFLGVNPPVAVGGSRSGDGQSICLLSPWPSAERKGKIVAVSVGIRRPVLLVSGQLNEIRLEKGGRILWQERASSTRPIEGPIDWPIQLLQPGEQITLKVRPRGSSGGDFSAFLLQAADQKVLDTNDRQVELLGDDPQVWNQYVDRLKPDQAATAAALWSSPRAPAGWRTEVQCSIP